MQAPILQVENLHLSFIHDAALTPVVRGLSYTLQKGKILAVVGESGSGKTVQALSVLNLLPPSACVEGGQILFQGKNLLTLSAAQLRHIRGEKIAMLCDRGTSNERRYCY